MKAIVMLLVLASVSFAQDGQDRNTHPQFVLIEDEGNFGISIAGFDNYGCINAKPGLVFPKIINNFMFAVISSGWQRRAEKNDSWAYVPETYKEGQVCGLPNPTLPGEYRWVAQIDEYWEDKREFIRILYVDRINIKSINTLVVAGDSDGPALGGAANRR